MSLGRLCSVYLELKPQESHMKHVAFAVFLAFGLTASAHAGFVANGSTVSGNV